MKNSVLFVVDVEQALTAKRLDAGSETALMKDLAVQRIFDKAKAKKRAIKLVFDEIKRTKGAA